MASLYSYNHCGLPDIHEWHADFLRKKRCSIVDSQSARFPFSLRAGHKEKKVKFTKSVEIALGDVHLDGGCVDYHAYLSGGDFFEGLELMKTPQGLEFRKNAVVVKDFPDEVVLGINVA